MSAHHRVSDETLGAFATGRLDEGLALVVAAHVEANPAIGEAVRELEAIGGGLIERGEPVAMLASAQDLLDRLPNQPQVMPLPRPAIDPDLPRVLAPYGLGRWQPIGHKVAMRRVAVPGAQTRVFMLRAGPGIRLPHHRHTGQEWTTILSGAYEHEYGRYAAGDFDEADENHEHRPVVDPVEGCTCLVALSGRVLFQGWLGRLLQPLVRL